MGQRSEQDLQAVVPVCLAGITTEGHCCWINGVVCPYLRDDGKDTPRRYVCILREELGSWEAVHTDPRYLNDVATTMRHHEQVDCGYWPGPGIVCGECGVSGDG